MDATQVELILAGIKRMRSEVRAEDLSRLKCAMGHLVRMRLPEAYVNGIQAEILQLLATTVDGCSVYLGFFGDECGSQFLKIGIARDASSRMSSHRTSNPLTNVLNLAAGFQDRKEAARVEAALLEHLWPNKATGEWVKFKGSIPACRAFADSLAEVASARVGRPVAFHEF